ncbi:hypothetical protein BGZ70_006768, partial [Mortierella alpina]
DDEWMAMRRQIENDLAPYGRLQDHGLADLVLENPGHYTTTTAHLNTIDLDALWDTSLSVMSTAYAHIPWFKTGGRPQPHGEEHLRAKSYLAM